MFFRFSNDFRFFIVIQVSFFLSSFVFFFDRLFLIIKVCLIFLVILDIVEFNMLFIVLFVVLDIMQNSVINYLIDIIDYEKGKFF